MPSIKKFLLGVLANAKYSASFTRGNGERKYLSLFHLWTRFRLISLAAVLNSFCVYLNSLSAGGSIQSLNRNRFKFLLAKVPGSFTGVLADAK